MYFFVILHILNAVSVLLLTVLTFTSIAFFPVCASKLFLQDASRRVFCLPFGKRNREYQQVCESEREKRNNEKINQK